MRNFQCNLSIGHALGSAGIGVMITSSSALPVRLCGPVSRRKPGGLPSVSTLDKATPRPRATAAAAADEAALSSSAGNSTSSMVALMEAWGQLSVHLQQRPQPPSVISSGDESCSDSSTDGGEAAPQLEDGSGGTNAATSQLLLAALKLAVRSLSRTAAATPGLSTTSSTSSSSSSSSSSGSFGGNADLGGPTGSADGQEAAAAAAAGARGLPAVRRSLALAVALAELYAAGMPLDGASIAAGIVAEAVDACALHINTVQAKLGPEVAALVHDVLAVRHAPDRTQAYDDASSSALRGWLLSAYDVRAAAIEVVWRWLDLAGPLSSSSSSSAERPKYQQQLLAMEALTIFCPLGHALGLGVCAAGLEDAAFKVLFPSSYASTARQVLPLSAAAVSTLAACESALSRALEDDASFSQLAGGVRLLGRAKSLYSIMRKLLRLQDPAAGSRRLGQMYDLLGLRAVVLPRVDLPPAEAEAAAVQACYRLQEVAQQLWAPLPGRTKDYIAAPKPNGYQSLHATLLLTPPPAPAGHSTSSSSSNGGSSCSSNAVSLSYLELQVRTAAMHAAAEGGDAAHSGYKGRLGRRQVRELQQWTQQLQRQLAAPQPQALLLTAAGTAEQSSSIGSGGSSSSTAGPGFDVSAALESTADSSSGGSGSESNVDGSPLAAGARAATMQRQHAAQPLEQQQYQPASAATAAVELFQHLDLDRDGHLGLYELTVLLQELGACTPLQQQLQQQQQPVLLLPMRADAAASAAAAAAAAAARGSASTVAACAQQLLEQLDANGDGLVSLSEFLAFYMSSVGSSSTGSSDCSTSRVSSGSSSISSSSSGGLGGLHAPLHAAATTAAAAAAAARRATHVARALAGHHSLQTALASSTSSGRGTGSNGSNTHSSPHSSSRGLSRGSWQCRAVSSSSNSSSDTATAAAAAAAADDVDVIKSVAAALAASSSSSSSSSAADSGLLHNARVEQQPAVAVAAVAAAALGSSSSSSGSNAAARRTGVPVPPFPQQQQQQPQQEVYQLPPQDTQQQQQQQQQQQRLAQQLQDLQEDLWEQQQRQVLRQQQQQLPTLLEDAAAGAAPGFVLVPISSSSSSNGRSRWRPPLSAITLTNGLGQVLSDVRVPPAGPFLVTNAPFIYKSADVAADVTTEHFDRLLLQLECVKPPGSERVVLTARNLSRVVRLRVPAATVYVNQQPLLTPHGAAAELSPGDVLECGQTGLAFQVLQQPGAVPQAAVSALQLYCGAYAQQQLGLQLPVQSAVQQLQAAPAAALAQLQQRQQRQQQQQQGQQGQGLPPVVGSESLLQQQWDAAVQPDVGSAPPPPQPAAAPAASSSSFTSAAAAAAAGDVLELELRTISRLARTDPKGAEQQLAAMAADNPTAAGPWFLWAQLAAGSKRPWMARDLFRAAAVCQQQQILLQGAAEAAAGAARQLRQQQQVQVQPQRPAEGQGGAAAAGAAADRLTAAVPPAAAAAGISTTTNASSSSSAGPLGPSSSSSSSGSGSGDVNAAFRLTSRLVQILRSWGRMEWDQKLFGPARRLWRLAANEAFRFPYEISAGGGGSVLHCWAAAEFERDNIINARVIVGEALRKCPRDAPVAVLAGSIEAAAGDFNAARALFLRAYQLSKADKQLYMAWPRMEATAGNIDRARALYQAGLTLYPNNTKILNLYACFEEDQGNVELARQLQRTALEVDSSSMTAMHNRVSWAGLELRSGNLDVCRQLLREGLDQHPDFPGALLLMAQLEQRCGNINLAEAYARRAQKYDAFAVAAHKELQQIYSSKGEHSLSANLRRHLKLVEQRQGVKLSGKAHGNTSWMQLFDSVRDPQQHELIDMARERKQDLGLIRSRRRRQQDTWLAGQQAVQQQQAQQQVQAASQQQQLKHSKQQAKAQPGQQQQQQMQGGEGWHSFDFGAAVQEVQTAAAAAQQQRSGRRRRRQP